MITFLEGLLHDKQPTRAVLNVNGVGYEITIPLSSYDRLPREGERCRLLTVYHITESEHRLFGFMTEEERNMFSRLLTISGIGPKLAISALSGLPVRELKSALIQGDVKRLASISGIGKKTAERIIVELKDKFSKGEQFAALAGGDAFIPDQRLQDASMALSALGHKPEDAMQMLKTLAPRMTPETTVEELIRMALST